MLLSDMDRKTLAITPPLLLLLSSFFFHLRGVAFGSSKAFHCLLLLSCLLLSSVNTLHNLADYDYNIAERFQSFNGGGGSVAAVQNVCPSSNLFSLLPALGSEYQFDPVVTFSRPSSCPGKSLSSSSSSALKSNNNNLSGVVWLSLKPVHIIEFQPFTGFSRIGGGTTPLSKELFAKQNTRELSISVSGKQCGGGNGLMEQKQCGGLSSGQGEDSIKYLFFYQTGLSCASGVAVFAVPMKSTAPVLMLSLCKKPVSWWLRAKKLSIALLIAVAALLVLIFCFNDHFIEERNNIAVSKAEKPSTTITISLEMDTLLRSISNETLQGSNEVVSENRMAPSSCGGETSELTVKTAKDKKRRRNKKKKKKGAVSELATTDVSSSQSGNSTPRSPMSPEPPAAVVVTQTAKKKPTTPKHVLSHSATFPVSGGKSVMIMQGSSLAPNARAPGAKSRSEVKEKEEEEEYRCYDIWGDHLTGLHLMDRFKEVREGRSSSSCFGEDEEFVSLFVKGPHHNLLPGSLANKPLIKK